MFEAVNFWGFWGTEAMRGNNFKEKKVVPLIFTHYWIRSHLNKLDRLTPKDVYYLTNQWLTHKKYNHFSLASYIKSKCPGNFYVCKSNLTTKVAPANCKFVLCIKWSMCCQNFYKLVLLQDRQTQDTFPGF